MRYLTKKMIEPKAFQRFDYPSDMDDDMIDLMDVLNNIPGCRTRFCCQGHGDGAWYFSVSCTYHTYMVLMKYFESVPGLDIRENRPPSVYSKTGIPVYDMSVYDDKFDSMPAKKRRSAYMKLCRGLLDFVPDREWRASGETVSHRGV